MMIKMEKLLKQFKHSIGLELKTKFTIRRPFIPANLWKTLGPELLGQLVTGDRINCLLPLKIKAPSSHIMNYLSSCVRQRKILQEKMGPVASVTFMKLTKARFNNTNRRQVHNIQRTARSWDRILTREYASSIMNFLNNNHPMLTSPLRNRKVMINLH